MQVWLPVLNASTGTCDDLQTKVRVSAQDIMFFEQIHQDPFSWLEHLGQNCPGERERRLCLAVSICTASTSKVCSMCNLAANLIKLPDEGQA